MDKKGIFFYKKGQKRSSIENINLVSIIKIVSLLKTGISWLTGLHIGTTWVSRGKNAETDKDTIEEQGFDTEKILNLAADRLENMFWFGILEDMERSLELFQFQMNGLPV